MDYDLFIHFHVASNEFDRRSQTAVARINPKSGARTHSQADSTYFEIWPSESLGANANYGETRLPTVVSSHSKKRIHASPSADLQTKNLLNGVTTTNESGEPNNNSTLIQNANPKSINSSLNTLNRSKTPTSGTLQSHYRTLHNRQLDSVNLSATSSTGSGSNNTGTTVSNASASGSNKNVLATYELSQEMIDKRVELLQRKYGPRAWAAAILIQRFWRKRQMSQRFRNLALHAAQALGAQTATAANGAVIDSNQANQSNHSINEPENMDLVTDVSNTEIILNDSLHLHQLASTNMSHTMTDSCTTTSGSALSGSGDSAISGLSTCSAQTTATTGSLSNAENTVDQCGSPATQLHNVTKSLARHVTGSQTNSNKPILKRYSNASLHSNSSTGSSGSSMCRSPTLPSLAHNSPNGGTASTGLLFGMMPGHPHLMYTAPGPFLTSAAAAATALLQQQQQQQPGQLSNSASAQMLSNAFQGNYFVGSGLTTASNQSNSTIPTAGNSYVQMLQSNNSLNSHPSAQLAMNISNASLPHSQCSQMSLTSNCVQLSPNRGSMCSSSSLLAANVTRLPVQISASQLPHLQLAQYEILRKRQYRVGLNLFNKQPPERGIQYLIDNGFIDANLLSYANASAFAEMALNSLDANETSPTTSNGTTPAGHDGSGQDQQLSAAVAHFLLTRKGLSKQMIGEYLGNLQRPFNQLVLRHFVRQLDLAGLVIDVALRKYQTYFRFPGEAQKIERLVEVFAEKYYQCNFECGVHPALIGVGTQTSMSKDEIFILSFAIIMLNTDLHVPNNKRRMTPQQWLKNLRGVFKESGDLEENFLLQIYERIKQNEFKTGHDHCNQVLKVQQTLVAASSSKPVPNLGLTTYRRLVCFCRLYEIIDVNKKTTKAGQHQREVFLFNDMLLVTKLAKSSSNPLGSAVGGSSQSGNGSAGQNLYTYRRSIMLSGCHVSLFSTNYYPFGIRISAAGSGSSSASSGGGSSNSYGSTSKPIIMFNARNDIDRKKFYEDLRESIAEITEMEMIRISAGSAASTNGSGPRLIGSNALAGNAFSPTHSSLHSKSNSLLDLTNCPITAIHSNGSIEVYGKQSKLI